MTYQYTSQRELRRAFWKLFPTLDRKKQNDGNYVCETRVMFVEWIDGLQKGNAISESLADRVTL